MIPCTFDQFVAQIVHETSCSYTLHFIEVWRKGITDGSWKKWGCMPLDEKLVASFAEDISEHFCSLIMGTQSDALYYDRVGIALDFLSLVCRISRWYGVSISLADLDFPLTVRGQRIYPKIFQVIHLL